MTKKVIIVGASSGIGKELALKLVKEDCLIGITGRRIILLEELQGQYPDKIICSQIDNTQSISLETELENLKVRLGGLDLLILSSGTGDINESLNFAIEKKTIDLNVTAFTNIADWTFNTFQKQGSGHFAAITSLAGMTGSYLAPGYNASKAYQINYLKGLRKRAAQLKLPVNITDIRPGFVDTAMAKGEGQFWVAPAQKAASQIVEAIKRKRHLVYITKRWAMIGLLFKVMYR
jgi:short-subunit dehydrogenase